MEARSVGARWARWLVPLAMGALAGCYDGGEGAGVSNDDEGGEDVAIDEATIPRAAGPLRFNEACRRGDQLTIAAVGDVLLHTPLQQQAYAARDGHASLWRGVSDLLARADVTYANLEGPTAAGVNSAGRAVADPGKVFDGVVYTSYPMFNYHPSLVTDLVTAGIDVVSTANNHALDRRALGVERTLDVLERASLPHTGTRRQGSEVPWYTTTTARGFTLAWLACTYDTNGIPDTQDQVLFCFRDADEITAMVRTLASSRGIDAVIVTPHWGVEYSHSPNNDQKRLAFRLLDAGALAVLGSHPHVLQPWERHVTPDGRETFVMYSLGNFVSGQSQLPRRTTVMLYLGLTRGDDGRVRVNGAQYVPMVMNTRGGVRGVEAIDRAGGSADSRALSTRIFGTWNIAPTDRPLVTNPECQ